MSGYKSEFLKILEARGFIYQSSNLEAIDLHATKGNLVAYAGYDCTATSLHVGNLTTLMILYWLQETGNQPLLLLGGATTLVGDPSGKDKTRQLLTEEQVRANETSIATVFGKIFPSTPNLHAARIVNNRDWLTKIGYIEMLRDVGRHFSVNRMLTADSVRLRIERQQEMSFLEFNYTVLQAYDFVHLAKHFHCNLQIGGSDQWGNIIAGIELGRRMHALALYGLTTPLLTTASGAKMGKTEDGAVWLDPVLCSPYAYWQYWRNVEDADVGRFARYFTTLPLSEITRMEALQGAEINEAKKILATEATAFLHGRAEAEKAERTARTAFEEGKASADLPTLFLPEKELQEGLGLRVALVRCGFAKSNGEAQRLIQGKAVRVNDILIEDDLLFLRPENLVSPGIIKLSLGKKRHALIKIQ